ncbi:hypothetical protein EMPG_09602 [Blastomyces silverae]|uniref:Uncharacterized protein n=1 Tax=Blastomyces silverae TaxID=2060906 RepID=A0A0H1BKW3_9EURO|nr:hypothetical protein EMPG_09602 [Blastomyces silverae]
MLLMWSPAHYFGFIRLGCLAGRILNSILRQGIILMSWFSAQLAGEGAIQAPKQLLASKNFDSDLHKPLHDFKSVLQRCLLLPSTRPCGTLPH